MNGGVRSAVRPVRLPSAKSSPRQILEMLDWAARLIVTPNDYRAHGLYLQGKTRHDAMRYVSVPRAREWFWPLNRDTKHIENKLLFECYFSALGLPVTDTLAVVGAQAPESSQALSLTGPEELQAFLVQTIRAGEQLALKPIDRWGGVGVHILQELDGEDFVLANGARRAVREVVHECADGVWLVQRRLQQHPDLARLNPSSLNTLRLGTFRRQNGEVEIVFAKLRIGRAGAQVDAVSKGGYSVTIDPQTGAFASQGHQVPKYSFSPASSHADSGLRFADMTYPRWGEVLAMGTAFANGAGNNRFLGWDVAMTVDGPVFVEGNKSWDVQLAQKGSSGMLTDGFLAMFNEETGARIDPTRVPPLRPLRAFRELRKTYY